jgi:hypothetical protein
MNPFAASNAVKLSVRWFDGVNLLRLIDQFASLTREVDGDAGLTAHLTLFPERSRFGLIFVQPEQRFTRTEGNQSLFARTRC